MNEKKEEKKGCCKERWDKITPEIKEAVAWAGGVGVCLGFLAGLLMRKK